VIFPVMLNRLFREVGYGWTMRICAFVILALLILANLTVRSRIPPSGKPFDAMAYIRPFGERTFLLLVFGMFFLYCEYNDLVLIHILLIRSTIHTPLTTSYIGALMTTFTFLVVDVRSYGMSDRLANYLVTIANAGSIFGRIIPNIAADRFGPFNITVISCTLCTILILGMWLPASGNPAATITFAALFGLVSGAGFSVPPVLVAAISPIQEIGVRTGGMYVLAAIAGLTGGPIGGQIIVDSKEETRYMKVFVGCCCAVGTGFFVACRVSLGGWGLKKL
jgi:MFS family permease